MFNWDRLEEVYKWVSASCPRLVDWTLVGIVFFFIMSSIYAVGWIATSVFGWHLLTLFTAVFLSIFVAWLLFTHSDLPGGIKEWWSERPWKK